MRTQKFKLILQRKNKDHHRNENKEINNYYKINTKPLTFYNRLIIFTKEIITFLYKYTSFYILK